MIPIHRFPRIACCVCAALLTACAKKDNAATDTTVATTTDSAPAPAPAPAAINLADIAGKWDLSSVPTTGPATAVKSVLDAKNTTAGWTITFPGRKPVAERVTVAGDSVITESDPYQSVLRKGVQVWTRGVFRLQNGNLVGQTTAHYSVKTADSVLVLNTTATRAK
ncbi:MAG TPA: hypothetical protein VM166_04745 [Gemmatimonadaceae bacterium]|nr:hypothetical protein [Gemmatimonadaceae bacterium]